jgi:hypothetical protein
MANQQGYHGNQYQFYDTASDPADVDTSTWNPVQNPTPSAIIINVYTTEAPPSSYSSPPVFTTNQAVQFQTFGAEYPRALPPVHSPPYPPASSTTYQTYSSADSLHGGGYPDSQMTGTSENAIQYGPQYIESPETAATPASGIIKSALNQYAYGPLPDWLLPFDWVDSQEVRKIKGRRDDATLEGVWEVTPC